MKNEISGLYETDFEICDFIAMHQGWWKPKEIFTMKEPRKNDAFLLFLSDKTICRMTDGEEFEIPRGSLVHLPHGAKYSWHFPDTELTVTLLFEFKLKNKSGDIINLGNGIRIIDTDFNGIYELLFNKLINEYYRPNKSPVFQKLHAYSLLTEIIKRQRKQEIITRFNDSDIYPGIKYLESDIEQSKSIKELAKMCNMSLSTFERHFKAYSGMTPVDYRLTKRLERAEILFKTEAMTLDRIAEELNFYDGAYLCKVFKNKKGYSLSSLRKQ